MARPKRNPLRQNADPQTLKQMQNRFELTTAQWNLVKPLLPPEHPKKGSRGRPTMLTNRRAINGMLWILLGKEAWRDLPRKYGAWQSVYGRYRKWEQMGVIEQVLEVLNTEQIAYRTAQERIVIPMGLPQGTLPVAQAV